MTTPNPGDRRYLMWYGTVEAAARDRATTADLWSRLRDHAESLGLSGPGLTIGQVNQLRGLASGVINAERNLGRAQPEYGIDSGMIAGAPWARDLAERDALPMFQVRFEHQVIVDGVPQSEWRTVMYRGQLPSSVGALQEDIEGDAQEMADNYGQEHVGVGTITILAV